MNNDRETIFAAISAALSPLPNRTEYPQWPDQLAVSAMAHSNVSTSASDNADPIALLRQRLDDAHAICLDGWEALRSYLDDQQLARGYLDAALASQAQPHLQGLELTDSVKREDIDALQFGITMASGAIAETGTLILRDRDCRYRLGALAPWVHIAVVRKSSVMPTLVAGIASLDNDPSIVFVTGPSKTADIEGILIQGVHGPGCQVCCLVDD